MTNRPKGSPDRVKGRFVLAVLLAFALAAAACGGDDADDGTSTTAAATTEAPATTAAPTSPPDAPTEVVIGLGNEPSSLDPHLVNELVVYNVGDNIMETLVTRDEAGELVPALATDLGTVLDDTTWQFKLREGVEFHNGESFNADTVVYNVERILAAEGSPQSENIGTVVGAETVDEYTVNITTSGPDPILPARLAATIHILPPVASADQESFGSNPIGTGPYKFVEWQRGRQVELEANDDYWGGRPEVDRARFLFFEEYGTRLAAHLSDEIDLMVDLLPEDIERVDQSFITPGGLKSFVVILNAQEDSPIDLRVRQALNYAVDKEAIATGLYSGVAEVLQGQMVASSWFGYDPSIDPYPYDPDRARTLLEDAGAVGTEIQLVSLQGNSLLDRELTEVVAGYWDAVGIKTDIFIPEFSEYIDRLIDRETRPTALLVPHDNFLQDADRTYSGYYDPEGCCGSSDDAAVGALIAEARTELDIAKRAELYGEIAQIVRDDARFVWLVSIKSLFAAGDDITWAPRADGLIDLTTISVAS